MWRPGNVAKYSYIVLRISLVPIDVLCHQTRTWNDVVIAKQDQIALGFTQSVVARSGEAGIRLIEVPEWNGEESATFVNNCCGVII
jgi:hypothetical protein